MTQRRSLLGRVLPTGQPQEVNLFLFLGGFALVITAIYWFASYEAAGTVLLLGFGVATGAFGVRLALDPRARRVRELGGDRPPEPPADLPERRDPGGRGAAAEGTAGVDRPFLDEAGRLPAETLAPLAVGLGASLAATGLIFGPAPVLVGVLPFLWGAWTWLGGARDELDAVVLDDIEQDAGLDPRKEAASRHPIEPAPSDSPDA